MTFTEHMKEMNKLGHIAETGECAICGATYKNYGEATWGYWNESPSEYYIGESKRCCSKCYKEKVIPARRKI